MPFKEFGGVGVIQDPGDYRCQRRVLVFLPWPSALPTDHLNAALVAFLRECIFQQMMSETATAFNRTADKNQAASAEWELHELVKVVVDVAMAAVLVGPVRALTRAQIEQFQTSAIRDVWTRWEANIQ